MERFIRYKVGMHKIYLPEILNNINKVIYMDGDTIVLKDLNSLISLFIHLNGMKKNWYGTLMI